MFFRKHPTLSKPYREWCLCGNLLPTATIIITILIKRHQIQLLFVILDKFLALNFHKTTKLTGHGILNSCSLYLDLYFDCKQSILRSFWECVFRKSLMETVLPKLLDIFSCCINKWPVCQKCFTHSCVLWKLSNQLYEFLAVHWQR